MLTILFTFETFMGCNPEPPDVVQNPLPACLEYTKDAELYGYCVYKNADSLIDISSVHEHCPTAGSWQEDCRQSWVMSHTNDYSLDDLMVVCELILDVV